MLSDVSKSLTTALTGLFKSTVTPDVVSDTLRTVCTTLLQTNCSPRLILELRTRLRTRIDNELRTLPSAANKAKVVQQIIFDELVVMLDSKKKPYEIQLKTDTNKKKGSKNVKNTKGSRSKTIVSEQEKPRKTAVILFVGLQGCGKTTTVCKYANYYTKRGLKTGIVCADTFRAGAFDQVKQNALRIKVPFFGSQNKDPSLVAAQGVAKFKSENFDLVLVDSSGRNTQEAELFAEMQDITHSVQPDNIVFVMDAQIGQSAEIQARGFSDAVGVGSIILTKMDGTSRGGGALSSVAVAGVPVEFIGTGEGIEDLEKFDARRFVGKLLGQGDVEGFFEKMSSLDFDEEKMMEKMTKGEFDLRDFYEQFQQLMSLGPLKSLAEMVPGMQGMAVDENVVRKMVCVFDSLCAKELDSDGSMFFDETKQTVRTVTRKRGRSNCDDERMNELLRCKSQVGLTKGQSRILRVARGSGTTPRMVMDLLSQFKQIGGLMKKMGKVPGFGDLANKDPSQMSLAEKTRMKSQMKGLLPKDMFDQISQMFK